MGVCQADDVARIVLRIYTLLFCALHMYGEFDPEPLYVYLAFLRGWLGRGLSLIFLAVLTLAACSDKISDTIDLIRQIAGWTLMGFGTIYFLLGTCCMEDARRRKIEQLNLTNATERALVGQAKRDAKNTTVVLEDPNADANQRNAV